MPVDMSSFGNAIVSGRREKGMSQKELAAKIIKEDGKPITPQYLNDIEHDRRQPTSDQLVKQFARVLGIDERILYGLIGLLPEQDRKAVRKATPDQVSQAFFAFRRELGDKPKGK